MKHAVSIQPGSSCLTFPSPLPDKLNSAAPQACLIFCGMHEEDWKALISSRGRPPVIIPLLASPARLSEMRPGLTPVRAFFSSQAKTATLSFSECQPPARSYLC